MAGLRVKVFSLEGKSCRDIVDCIRSFIEVDVAGLDNTAANEALEHIMDMLELEMSTSERSYDEVMTNILTEDSIKDMLDEFLVCISLVICLKIFLKRLDMRRVLK